MRKIKLFLEFVSGNKESLFIPLTYNDISKKLGCSIDEVEDFENAQKMAEAGVDGIQFDKVSSDDLKNFVTMLKEKWPQVTLIAAGGINQENIEEYAKTGVDAIVTSCVFHGKPLDHKGEGPEILNILCPARKHPFRTASIFFITCIACASIPP